MDIASPKVLKFKGVLFLLLGILSGTLLLLPQFDIRQLLLFVISVWSFCRAYYFCFYVIHHYIDPQFRYAGLISAFQYLQRMKRVR